jgi:hypothetical protein
MSPALAAKQRIVQAPSCDRPSELLFEENHGAAVKATRRVPHRAVPLDSMLSRVGRAVDVHQAGRKVEAVS